MRLVLEVISGPHEGQKIEVADGKSIKIGRTTKSDIALQDTFMSGQHFAVECAGKSCRLIDLGSRNGTNLNGKRVAKAKLREGDRIYAGRTDFIVRIEQIDAGAGKPTVSRFAETVHQDFEPVTDTPEAQTSGMSGGLPSSQHTPSARSKPASDESGVTELAPPDSSPPVSTTASPPIPSSRLTPTSTPVKPPPIKQRVSPSSALDAEMQKSLASYEAATPEGRLVYILRNQPEPVMALVDAIHAPKLLELLSSSGEEYQSLYQDQKTAAIAPYLVRLPPQTPLLKTMLHEGWGKGWGVYLTSSVPLKDLREYFRRELMVKLPDGAELFSRFYEPKFFRPFLETCTPAEAERFFGPISSYFMESDRPEILLQFKKIRSGVEKKGHLLSVLE